MCFREEQHIRWFGKNECLNRMWRMRQESPGVLEQHRGACLAPNPLLLQWLLPGLPPAAPRRSRSRVPPRAAIGSVDKVGLPARLTGWLAGAGLAG